VCRLPHTVNVTPVCAIFARSLQASVAQLAEQLTLNQRVVGSSPSGRTTARPEVGVWPGSVSRWVMPAEGRD
jgi:hypothetical protein